MEYKKELIGEGGHWIVKRIFIFEDGIEKTIIHKKSKNQNSDNVEKNLKNYSIIYSAGLPTLMWFVKSTYEIEGIETEDLNPPNKCDGYFVSPNTIRGCPSYASLLVKFLDSNQDKETFIKFNEVNSEFSEYLDNQPKIEEDLEKIQNKFLVKGAEGIVYSNKITEITNLSDFLIQVNDDLKKASKIRIELYFDAFFYRVKESTKQIEYKIADFDCIASHEHNEVDENRLYAGNLEYLTTSLWEFIKYFVIEEKKEEYFKIIEYFKNKNEQ